MNRLAMAALMCTVLTGCGQRYELVALERRGQIFRIDTATGETHSLHNGAETYWVPVYKDAESAPKITPPKANELSGLEKMNSIGGAGERTAAPKTQERNIFHQMSEEQARAAETSATDETQKAPTTFDEWAKSVDKMNRKPVDEHR